MKHHRADHVAVRSSDFSRERAGLILAMRDVHDIEEVTKAAIWMVGDLGADDEDVRLAAALLDR